MAIPAVVVLGGCENDSGKADKKVADDLSAAASANANTAPGRAAAHKSLDDAVKVTGASLSLQLQAKVMLADAELRLAQDVSATVASNSVKIGQLVSQIAGATAAVSADNGLASALSKYEPTPVLDKLKTQSSAMAGSEQSPNWAVTSDIALGSQSAADKAVAALQQQIDQLQQQVKSDGDQRNDLLGKADKLDQQSEQEQHQKSVDLFVQGADARKQAADLAVKIEGETSQLARAQADLAVQRAEQGAVKAGVQLVDTGTSAVNQGWTSTQEQIRQVKAHAASLVGDPASPTDSKVQATTINSMTADLAKLREQNRRLVDDAETHYNNAIGFYKDAHDRAKQLLTLLGDPAHTERPERTDKIAWDVDKAATDPSQFQYLQATTEMERAGFYARLAADAQAFAELTTAVKPVLETASLEVPSALADTNGDAALAAKNYRGLATKGFKDAVELLGNVTNGAAPSDVALRQGATVATMFADYGLSLLATAAGDTQEAAVQMQAAKTAEKNAAEMPALPGEIGAGSAGTMVEPAAVPAAAASMGDVTAASLVGHYGGRVPVPGGGSLGMTLVVKADGHFMATSVVRLPNQPGATTTVTIAGPYTVSGTRVTFSTEDINGRPATPAMIAASGGKDNVMNIEDGGQRLTSTAGPSTTLTKQP